jgi:hypothetical protein
MLVLVGIGWIISSEKPNSGETSLAQFWSNHVEFWNLSQNLNSSFLLDDENSLNDFVDG